MMFLKANWLLISEYGSNPHVFTVYLFVKRVTFWCVMYIVIKHIKNNVHMEYISEKPVVIVPCF